MMNTRFDFLIVLSLAAIIASGCASAPVAVDRQAVAKYAGEIDKLTPGMSAPEIPAREEPQQTLEKMCHQAGAPGKDKDRAALCVAMVTAAADAKTPKPARVWMLRKLDTLGGEEVVAALTTLLKDSDVEIRDLARRALANNSSPKAVAALRTELARADEARWQAAIINALGWRKDAASVPAFAKLARSDAQAVAAAAVAALGDVGNLPAADALADLRQVPALHAAAVDASLRVADSLRDAGKDAVAVKIYEELLAPAEPEHVRVSAVTGFAATMGGKAAPRLIEFVTGSDAHMRLISARCLQRMDMSATPAIVKALEASRPELRPLLLEVLGEHGDPAALTAVVKQASNEDVAVRIAAIKAIGKIGNSTTVLVLVTRGVQGQAEEREAARASMSTIRGKDVDEVILNMLRRIKGPERVELLYAVWGRRIASASPLVFVAAADPDEATRVAALTALERLAKTEDLAKLVDFLVKARDDSTRKAAGIAIGSCCRRANDDERCAAVIAGAMEQADPAAKQVLIRALANVQSNAGLTVLRAAAKSADTDVKKAATEAMAQWKPTRVTKWEFSGPYRQEGKKATELFDVAFPPEESPAEAKWKTVKVGKNDSTVDLLKMAKGENCCGYLKTVIKAPEARDVVLAFGSDDGVKVWLNDKVVHGANVTRGLKCEEDQVTVSLKKGDNVLLVKITQGAAEWSLCCGVRAAEGGPADGLEFAAK